jgi:hypothetical protein
MQPNRQHDFAMEEDTYYANRRELIRADLESRLGKVCANFSEDDFRTLVERMIEQKLRSERKSF